MKKYLGSILLFAAFCIVASAQKIPKPTLTSSPATQAQAALIQEGARLHDQGRYDEAIKNYQQVLKENPDCTQALYEMALSNYKKKDFAAFSANALQGVQYKSDELPLFYTMIANFLDDSGKPKEALQVYLDAIKILEGTEGFERYLSSVYYNLGVTYARQKQYNEAREL